jgi:superfamily II DNA/RNA helicase
MTDWPDVDILFIDELHACMRASIIKLIEQRPTLKIVGATATPFHPAIGKYFSSVTSVTTMSALVKEDFLVPFRVFVAKEIDTRGLKVVAGEWKKDDLEKRGQEIIGDVVADYIRISTDVFGEFRKTICFSCGIAHGADLAAKFIEAGINAIQISSNDEEDYRKEVLAEFAKADSDIKILISVAILSRGFDQTDVEHVILARPLKKSFSEHVQMVGRGARTHNGKNFCIASGQKVLTHRGLIAIEKVSLYDRLWDGNSFVSHKGVIYKGIQDVITYQGLTATPGHRVKTKEGWRTLGECSEKQIPIVKTGFGWTPIRESENLFSECRMEGEALAKKNARSLRMSNLFNKVSDFIQQSFSRNSWWLFKMQSTKNSNQQSCSSKSSCTRATLHKSKKYSLLRLWWSWNSIQVRNCFSWLFVGNGKFATTNGFEEVSIGSNKQRKTLRTGEFEMGNKFNEFISYTKTYAKRTIAFIQDRKSHDSLRRSNTETLIQYGINKHSDHRKISQAIKQTKREVWDILDSGSRNCFTCEGLLVHNCVIQDNSGNWLRFKDDWETLYHDGVTDLQGGQDSKAKKEPTEKEKAAAKCPKCGHLWSPSSNICSNCGLVRSKKSDVIAIAGEMVELGSEAATKAKKDQASSAMKETFFQELLGYAKFYGYKDGWAFHKYQEKFGLKPPWKKVTRPASITTTNWIKSRSIAYNKAAK